MAEILHRPRCHPNIEILGLQGEASKVLSCNTWLAVQDFSHQQYSNRLVALHPWSGWSFFEETLPVQIEYTLLEFFPVFFQLHILVCSFLQLHSSCNPVANSSCKFYLHWGKHSQTQKLSKQILIRYQVSMSDELANASPNVNRICNWNLQLDCNWNATAGNCTQEYVTGKNTGKNSSNVYSI